MLSLKEAYYLKAPLSCARLWAKDIWSPNLPQSKSIFSWKLILQRVSPDDQILSRGVSLASMCPLCKVTCESISHLFSSCRFATVPWNWFYKMCNFFSRLNSFEDILHLRKMGFCKQGSLVLRAAAIYVVWNIWRS